jgi:hypothetical protein
MLTQNFSASQEINRGSEEGKVELKHKHEVKFNCPCNEHKFKFVPSSKNYEFEYEYIPKMLNEDGRHASASFEGTCTPQKNQWTGKAEFKLGGFKLGPLGQWMEMQFDTNHSQRHLLTLSHNTIFENYHVAWKAVTDINAQTLDQAYGILAMKNENGDFYMRSNCLNRLVSLGAFFALGKNAHHVYEAQYDFYGKNTGMFGLPLFLRWGGHYHLENGTKITSRLFLGKQWLFTNHIDVPILKQLKLTVSEQADLYAAINSPKDLGYKMGIAMEFKA